MGKLKILQIAPQFPFPEDDGGKIGIANIYKEFSRQGASVTLFAFRDSRVKKVSEKHIVQAEKFGNVRISNYNTRNTFPRIISSLFHREPLFTKKFKGPETVRLIENIAREGEFDVIHADHSSMADLAFIAKAILSVPVGLRMHNIEWMIWQRYALNINDFNPKRWYIYQQAKRLKKKEADIFGATDINFAITENDKERAHEMTPEAKIIVASAGVHANEWQPDYRVERDPREMILATIYSWPHNVDAVKWLIQSIIPRVRKVIPGARLTLLGKSAPSWLSDRQKEGVYTQGYVPKVQPFLNKASIYVAPLFVGAGIRIKILEAMAMELPVVATSISAEGINASEEEGLFIRDDEQSFSDVIVELMKNPEEARKRGKKAREYILANFSWSRNVKIMMDEYRRLTGK